MKLRRNLSWVLLISLAASCAKSKGTPPSPAPAGAASTGSVSGGQAAGTTAQATAPAPSQVPLLNSSSPAAPVSPATPQNPFASLISSLLASFSGGSGTSGSSPTNAAAGVATASDTAAQSATTMEDWRNLCVATVNQYRATIGKAALTRNTSASSCTDGQALADSKGGWAHGAFGKCGEMAQDECPGYSSPVASQLTFCLKQMWDEGPWGGHYQNMSGEYTQIECGFAQQGDSWWMVQNFW